MPEIRNLRGENMPKWVLRGYGEYGGSWSKGETKEEAVNRLVNQGLELNAIDVFKVPEDVEIQVFKSGSIRFTREDKEELEEEEIQEEEMKSEELDKINERIKNEVIE